MTFEIPPILAGTAEEQLESLWRYLYRLVEKLNVENAGEQVTTSDTGFTAKAYTELRDMIGNNAKTANKLEKDKVSHAELVTEPENALREAEQSGAFDGNGISSATMDEEYKLTLGFTDGSFFTTPSLRGAPVYEVGDIFVTQREGDPAALLGYGTWEQISSSPALMWARIS